jgi:ankyrin repeat protein
MKNHPIYEAIVTNNDDAVKAILETETVEFIRNNTGETPLMYAALSNNLEAIKLLIGHTSTSVSFPMVEAATSGTPEIMEFLIGHGGNPNGNDNCQTPLMEAIDWGYAPIVELLLKHGANVDRTSLDFAIRRGHKAIADIIERNI